MSSMISKKMGIAVNDRKVTDCIAKVCFVDYLKSSTDNICSTITHNHFL